MVNGTQLAISVHARSKRDRRYAEDFGAAVVKTVYASVTTETGKGLIIIGEKHEPHPVSVFRRFLELAQAGKLDPAVAARGPELSTMLEHWSASLQHGESAGGDGGEPIDLDFETMLKALPLPLEGIGAQLYQLAWAETFDPARVDARLLALRAADLERDLFAHFDWVFYLPPRGAFDQALKDLIDAALHEEDVGFFARTAIKGALLLVKPKISRAIEGLRRGVLFKTVVQARTDYSAAAVQELTDAYMEASVPEFGAERGPRLTPVEAVMARRRALAERTAATQVDDADPAAAAAADEAAAAEATVEGRETAGAVAVDPGSG